MQKDEGKEQGQGNGERHDHRRAEVDQKGHQHEQDKNHSEQQIVFDSVDGQLNKIAAVVIWTHFHVRREDVFVEFLSFGLDAFQHVLRLLAAPHHDDAFHGIIGFIEAEFTQAGSVANDNFADVGTPLCVPTMMLSMSEVSRTRPMPRT